MHLICSFTLQLRAQAHTAHVPVLTRSSHVVYAKESPALAFKNVTGSRLLEAAQPRPYLKKRKRNKSTK